MLRRRLFTLCSALSLLLCAAVCVLWVRSRWHFDDVHVFAGPQRYWLLRSAEGRLYVQQTWADGANWERRRRVERWSGELGRARYWNLPCEWQAAGFGYGRRAVPSRGGVSVTARVYLVPHAAVATAFAVAPALWLRLSLRRRTARARRVAGLCPRCGYDLRASPGRCPECGAAAAASSSAAAAAGPR